MNPPQQHADHAEPKRSSRSTAIARRAALACLPRAGLAMLASLLVVLGLAPGASAAGWAVVPTPNASGWPGTDLNGVSCPSSSSCTAVGSTAGAPSGQGISEAWTGTSWMSSPVAPSRPTADRHGVISATCA